MTIADRPHGRSRYNAGCRCGQCRASQREYQRNRRAKQLHPVPDIPGVPAGDESTSPGPVATAVAAELAGLPAADERPGLAAIALRLAELLDDPQAMPHFAAAAGRLVDLLQRLGKSSHRRGRLTAVRDMTGREN